MIFADMKDGILINRTDGPCHIKPQRCMVCGKFTDPRVKTARLCNCGVARIRDDGCVDVAHAFHNDLAFGSTRVIVDHWPAADFSGPWTYDAATRSAVPNASATKASREGRLLDASRRKRDAVDARSALFAAGVSTATMDAIILAEQGVIDDLARKLTGSV